ncbi:hypothetical protein [Streptomyces caatingaensis]|nr:hypothetical protein [Streptomyces caatingaensis]
MYTEEVLTAVRDVAARHGRTLTTVEHDIGADRVSRRTGAPLLAVTDPDGSLPHEVYAEIAGPPAVELTVHPEGDTRIVVEGVEFADVPHEHAAAFLDAVYAGRARLRTRLFPPATTLVVPVPGDVTYREPVGLPVSPWLSARRH